MDIKLITLDLDKTLLRDDGSISDYSLNILDKCRREGILIAIATARSEYSAKKYVEMIEPDIVITSGGAVARSGNKILHRALIPESILNFIIQDALKQPSIECIRVMGEIHELSNKTDLPDGMKDYGHYDYSDLNEHLFEDAWKIQFETKDISFLNSLIEKYPDCELTSYHNEDLHKIANVHANKLDAIKKVCSVYGIDMEDVAAFGDDISDYDLIGKVGMGVAVANAIDKVKDIADFVCHCNEEDGVAVFIDEHIRGEE